MLMRTWAALTCAVAMLTMTGCMAPAHMFMEVEKADHARSTERGMALLRQHIKTLQDQGDPMGDYYYAMANADGWIDEVKDPKAITALFEKAAAKGAMDARILLALQVATSEPVPGRLDYAMSPRGNVEAWEQGLAKLLPLLQQQCYARRLVVDEGRPQVAYYSIAYKVWPRYRDGHSIQNAQREWELRLKKDAHKQEIWQSIDEGCNNVGGEYLDLIDQVR